MKVAPNVAPSPGRRDETVSIQHVVTSGVCVCAVCLHTHVHQCARGEVCCLDEIDAIVLFFRDITYSPAHLVLGDPVPLGLQGMGTVVSSWCQVCPQNCLAADWCGKGREATAVCE